MACRPVRHQRLPGLGTDRRYCGGCRTGLCLVPASPAATGDNPGDRLRRSRPDRDRRVLVALAVSSARCCHVGALAVPACSLPCALVLAGALLALARRLRLAPPYALAPPRWLGVGVDRCVCASLLAWVVVSAGEPFVQARLETANTVSTTTTAPPDAAAGAARRNPRLEPGGASNRRHRRYGGWSRRTAIGRRGDVRRDHWSDPVALRAGRRQDAASSGSKGLLVSADGRTIAAHLPYDDREPAGIELPTYAVLDAVSGEVLTEVTPTVPRWRSTRTSCSWLKASTSSRTA